MSGGFPGAMGTWVLCLLISLKEVIAIESYSIIQIFSQNQFLEGEVHWK
jgi:hypothetical protein